jgi:myosin heavy subunit
MAAAAGGRKFQVGTDVWVPCSDAVKAAFSAGKVLERHEAEGAASVAVPGQPTSRFAFADIRLRFVRDDGGTSADSTSLVYMNDASILENMQRRHEQDLIYTYTASVLLAVNPYRSIESLYGDSQCEQYRGKHIGALPPHPYAIAESAYRLLGREAKNQAMLISGESGAGKTETAKIVMQYLAFVSGTGSDFAAELKAHVLRSQPVLESIGNAATLRNSNSNRFGKYNKIFFDGEGALAHASITTYLLESSRVVGHSEKEDLPHFLRDAGRLER